MQEIMIKRKAEDGILHPLFCQYQGQTSAQPAYLEIDFDDVSMRCLYSAEIGNAIPMCEWHGRIHRFPISRELTGAECNELMDVIKPAAQELCALYECVWDGSNHKGSFHKDPDRAEELMTLIRQACEQYQTSSGGVAYADDYFWGKPALPDDLTAETTDEQLKVIALHEEEIARDSGLTVIGVYDCLERRRDEMRDEARERSENDNNAEEK